MKKLFSLLFVLCVILLTGASAQPTHQWTKHYSWQGWGLYNGMTLLTTKTGDYVVGGQRRLAMFSNQGDSLWNTYVLAGGKDCAVNAIIGEYIVVGGNNSLLLMDYQGNLIRQIPVPTERDLLLNIWVDLVSGRYIVSGTPNIYEENILFVYDENLNLVSSHSFEGQLVDVGRKGDDIFTLQILWAETGSFHRLYRRNSNFEVINFKNFSSNKAMLEIGENTVALLTPNNGEAGYGSFIRFLNFQLDSVGQYDVPGDTYTAGTNTTVKFPFIYDFKRTDEGFLMIGRFLHWQFFEHQGWYPTYPDGYLQAISPTGEVVWTVRDSGLTFMSGTLDNGELVIGGGYTDLVLYKYNIVSGFRSEELRQGSFRLEQNHPNPFNPTTNIKFVVEKPSFVSLKVYDLLGNEVAQLVKKELSAGNYDVSFDGSGLASGVYIYQLQENKHQTTKKMVLMK